MDRSGAASALRALLALLLGGLLVGGIGVLRAFPAARPADAGLEWLTVALGGGLAALSAAAVLIGLVEGIRHRRLADLLDAGASAALAGGAIAIAAGADETTLTLAVTGASALLLASVLSGSVTLRDVGSARLVALVSLLVAEAVVVIGLLPASIELLEPIDGIVLGLAAVGAAGAGLVAIVRGAAGTGLLVAVGAVGLLASRDASLEALVGMAALVASQVVALGAWLPRSATPAADVDERLPELADRLSDAVLRFDGSLRLREWNRVAAELLGLDRGSVGVRADDLLGFSVAEVPADGTTSVARTAIGGLEVAVHRSGGGLTAVVRDPGSRPEAERVAQELRSTIDELLRARRTIDLQRAELERASTVDALTGVSSRSAILERLRIEVAEARRYRHPLAVVLLDVDGFGAINQELGAGAGDTVLREVALRFRLRVREADALGRVGSDGFIAVLPHTEESGAATFADALRHRLVIRPVAVGDLRLAVTVSIGVTTMRPGEDLDLDGLLARGLEALESASRAGGDRIALDRQHGLARLEDPHESDAAM